LNPARGEAEERIIAIPIRYQSILEPAVCNTDRPGYHSSLVPLVDSFYCTGRGMLVVGPLKSIQQVTCPIPKIDFIQIGKSTSDERFHI
jgi:hypothetical protein